MALKMANNNIKTSIYTYCNTLLQHDRNTCASATKSVEPNKLAGMKVFSLRLLNELFFSRSCGLYMLLLFFLQGAFFLRYTRAADGGGAHLSEHFVQPLQRTVQVQFYPAGGASHCLPPDSNKEREIKRDVRKQKHTAAKNIHTLEPHLNLCN